MSTDHLAVLRIGLPAAKAGIVDYELEVAGAITSEQTIYEHPASDFKIPNWLLPDKATDDRFEFSLPEELTNRIRVSVDALLEADRPLWLHLVEPYGYLGLVPWERMLVPVLERPVLRLPEVSSRRSAGRRLDVVLCVNPPAKEILHSGKMRKTGVVRRAWNAAANTVTWVGGFTSLRSALGPMMDAIVEGAPVPVRLHVFTNTKWRLVMSMLADKRGWGSDNILFYHVGSDDEAGAAESTESEVPAAATQGVYDPWLTLILDRIGVRVDAVHFVSHGGVAFNRGALTFGPPDGKPKGSWSSVSPMEMSRFLAQLGPSVVGFSTPPHDPAATALRYFADGLARLRPNPVFFHEIVADPAADTVRKAYEVLFADAQVSAPRVEHGFVYCDPSYVREEPDVDSFSNLFAKLDAEPSYLDDESPRWAMALQSHLDRREMMLKEWDLGSRTAVSAADEEELQGIESALDLVTELMREHLTAEDGEITP